MFLFENFKYNEEEARKIYGDSFRYASSWIDDVLMDEKYISQFNTPEERGHFMFSVNTISMPSNMSTLPFKVLEIHEYGVAENKRIPLDKVQKEYIKKKLSVLGDAVNIVDDNYNDGKAIAITYDISKDEYRWNLVHKQIKDREDKLNNAVSKIEISEPSLEAWTFMLKSFYNGKNPRVIFKKYKGNLDQLMQYLIVAHKLNWTAAVKQINDMLYTCFGDGRWITPNDEQANPYKEAAKRAAERYEPDEDIQELIDDYKGITKSQKNIPSKAKPIAELLDNDSYIVDYSIYAHRQNSQHDPLFEINVNTEDGKNVWIVVKHYGGSYYLASYQNRILVQGHKIYADYAEYKNKINKHTYFNMNFGFGRGPKQDATLKNVLDLWWEQLMQDIKDYRMK